MGGRGGADSSQLQFVQKFCPFWGAGLFKMLIEEELGLINGSIEKCN